MSFQKNFKKDFQKQNWSVMHPSVKEEIENGEQTKFIAGLVYPDLRPKIYDQDFSKIEQFSEIERREKIIRSTPSPRRVSLKVDETRFPQSWKELKRRRYSESDQFLVNKSSLLRTKQNVSKILTGLKHRNLKKRDLKCLRKRRESSSIHSNSKFDQHRDLEDIDNSSVSSHIVYADTKIIKWNPSLSHQSSQEDHSERNIFGDFSHKSLNEFKSHPNSWMLINKGRIDLEGTEINIESPCTLINGLNNSHLIIPTSSSKVIIEAIQTEGGSNKKISRFFEPNNKAPDSTSTFVFHPISSEKEPPLEEILDFNHKNHANKKSYEQHENCSNTSASRRHIMFSKELSFSSLMLQHFMTNYCVCSSFGAEELISCVHPQIYFKRIT